ncbi:22709_t:CDS:1, partial [Racocetra persica]
EISDTTIKNCWKTTKIIPKVNELEINKPEISEQENKSENKIFETNDVAKLVNNFSSETNLAAQKLIYNNEKYAYTIDQIAITKNILIDESIVKMIMNEFYNNNDETDDNKGSPSPSLITIIDTIE